MRPQGLLVLNKPIGIRSTRCVDIVRKSLRAFDKDVKVGHGGTLDSSASGVLVLLIGKTTRLSSTIMQMPKLYRTMVQLGAETSTCDYTGDVRSNGDWSGICNSDIRESIYSFFGWRMQVPPEISAVHVNGERAHKISRAGGTPNIEPRPVFIKNVEVLSGISPDGKFDLHIECGKGTYVRSIVRDIGRKLGCGAFVASLTREAIGPFDLASSFHISEILDSDEKVRADTLIDSIISTDRICGFFPGYSLADDGIQEMLRGLKVPLSSAKRITFGSFCPDDTVCIASEASFTVARIELEAGVPMLVPSVNIVGANGT